jgi:hypothetical protein
MARAFFVDGQSSRERQGAPLPAADLAGADGREMRRGLQDRLAVGVHITRYPTSNCGISADTGPRMAHCGNLADWRR